MQENILLLKELCLRFIKSLRQLVTEEDITRYIKEGQKVFSTLIFMRPSIRKISGRDLGEKRIVLYTPRRYIIASNYVRKNLKLCSSLSPGYLDHEVITVIELY